MPGNTSGGKKYKKRKNVGEDAAASMIDRQPGQIPGRVLRLLGNRNVLCYSNDDIVRIGHICGKMKGRVFIGPGDMILMTLRDFGANTTATERKKIKNADIIAKYHQDQFSSLKKEDGVNPKLFMKLEDAAGCRVTEIGADMTNEIVDTGIMDGFDFEGSSDEEEEKKEEEEEGHKTAKTTQKGRGDRQLAATQAMTAECDVDLDDL